MNTDDSRCRVVSWIVIGVIAIGAIWAFWDSDKRRQQHTRYIDGKQMRLIEKVCGINLKESESSKIEELK